MYSILQEYLLKAWDAFIFSKGTEILCLVFVVYAMYHLLLILNDRDETPERDNYVRGQDDITVDSDESTATQYELDDAEYESVLKSFQRNQKFSLGHPFGGIADNETNDYFNRILDGPEGSSSDVTVDKFEPASHSSDEKLTNTDSSLAGPSDGTGSIQLPVESGDGIYPPNTTTVPIANSISLRKKRKNYKKK